MRTRLKQAALIALGAVLGVLISLNFSAVAQRTPGPLPIEDLRAFTEVFGRIKSDYVEPVDDKKLITEAINGMLSGLDPHSAYLDAEAFRELQVGHAGRVRRAGHRSRHGRRLRQGHLSDRRHPCVPRGAQAGRSDHQAGRQQREGHDAQRRGQAHARQAQHRHHPDHYPQRRAEAPGDHLDARGHPDPEREGQAGRAGLRIRARHPVPGAHSGEDGGRAGEDVQGEPGADERPGARPAQ